MIDHLEVRAGRYHDSVTLLRVSRSVGDVEGVEEALVAMATDLNRELLADLGFDAGNAGSNDLVIAVRATDEKAVSAAREAAEEQLRATASGAGLRDGLDGGTPPRSIRSAATRGDHRLALISVPGRYAFVEAMEALAAGLNVMVFSDNVPLEQEVALKAEGARRGLLVMGPDCGTAIVAGVGLGFTNAVRPGPVGIVAASGTGAQQLCCLLDDAGIGVRHVLGVGGRDLSAQVGGASTLAALAALDDDPATDLIAIISKPPAPEVARRVREAAASVATPTVVTFIGTGSDLTDAAAEVQRAHGREVVEPHTWPAPVKRTGTSGDLRGLFAGGTLCEEAMTIAAEALGPIRSNVPLSSGWELPHSLRAPGHVMIDFGDDRLTQGRPHPMIDNRMRVHRIAEEAADPDAGVLLIDVVLGYGAHADPASELAPALRDAVATAAAQGRDLACVVSLCGAAGDPQGRDRQAEAFVGAGASVHLSNAAAARKAVELTAKD